MHRESSKVIIIAIALKKLLSTVEETEALNAMTPFQHYLKDERLKERLLKLATNHHTFVREETHIYLLKLKELNKNDKFH